MGFVASKAVTPLEWDFSDYGGGRGVSPEPSTKQIERYFRRQRHIVEALLRVSTAAADAEADRLRELTPQQAKAEVERWSGLSYDQAFDQLEQELTGQADAQAQLLHQRYAELIAETTNNCPSTDQIMMLPHRLRAAYFGWFTGQLTNPEFAAAGTKPSLSLVNNDGLGT